MEIKGFSVNIVLIICNVILFFISDFSGIFLEADFVNTIGLAWQNVFRQQEYYRLITSMFFHADADHLLNNMLVMFVLGEYVESYVGHLKYFILYFSTGIIAGFTSMVYNMFRNSYSISIGASGAIFGLMGALLMTVIFQKGRKQEFNLRQMLFMVFFSLYGGFASQGVDNAAHIGGFLGGVLLTTILCLKERRDTESCYE